MGKAFNTEDQSNLFKINYYKKSANMYNSENVLQGRIRKRYDFTGRQRFVSTPMSFSGGVGSGVLPKSNAGIYEGAIINSNKVYATCEIEREAIKASANNQGAFVQATKETVKKTVESYMRNSSRILFGDGTGILADGDATTTVTGLGTVASPYILSFPLPSVFRDVNFEEKDYVQMVDAGAYEDASIYLEVVDVNAGGRVIKLVNSTGATAGSTLLTAGAFGVGQSLVMQGSLNEDPTGLKKILDYTIAETGSLYNIAYQRRWAMTANDAGGAGVTTDLMNGVMLDVERKFGKVPNLVMCHYNQFRKILALLEDQKVYNLPNRNLKGSLSFQGIEYMSTRGPIGIFVDRFCEEGQIWFLNDDFIETHHRPDFGWFDDDGTVFLREQGSDSYGARYGGYYENFITPTAHGCLHNLTTA